MLGLAFATLASLGYVQDPAQAPESPSQPEVQRPTGSAESPTAAPASTEASPPSAQAVPAAESEAPTSPGGVEPAALPPSEAEAPPTTATPQPSPEAPTSNIPEPTSAPLLAPSEEETRLPVAPRPRAGAPRGDLGVSKDEALRRYYAKLYRPADNPVRPNVFVHGGMVVLGSSATDLNGRMGMIGAEAGPSWNKFSIGIGGDLYFGALQLDNAGDTVSTFGASGQLNVGLGRLGYTRRAILDPRLGYRLTYFPLKAGDLDSPEPEASYMVPHGPEFRLDAAFMISRTREPRFFHVVGISIALQAIVNTIGLDQPVYAAPRIGLVYGFG